ncbi:hypothetical protein D3C87_1551700 [compost metagenome]
MQNSLEWLSSAILCAAISIDINQIRRVVSSDVLINSDRRKPRRQISTEEKHGHVVIETFFAIEVGMNGVSSANTSIELTTLSQRIGEDQIETTNFWRARNIKAMCCR